MQLQSAKPFAVIGMAVRDSPAEPPPDPALLAALTGGPRSLARPRLLRRVWEALEDAGIVPSQLRGTPVMLLFADGADEVRHVLGLAADVDDADLVLAGEQDCVVVLRALSRALSAGQPIHCTVGGGADAGPEIARLVRPVLAPYVSGALALGAAPAPVSTEEPRTGPISPPWVLSAPTPQGVAARSADLRDLLAASTSAPRDADLGWSLATTREAFPRRAAIVGADRAAALDALARGEFGTGTTSGVADTSPGVVFVFPGQGPQWQGMAVELLDAVPVFAARFRECARALEPYLTWRVEDVLRGERSAPAMVALDVVQPVLFAVMVALADMWRSLGVRPAAVVGHCLGEVAAACVSGALSLDDSARIVTLWSQAQATLAGHGDMMSIPLPPPRVRELLGRYNGDLELAGINGPALVTVSGRTAAVDDLLARLHTDGVRARKIPVGFAGHSVQVDALREGLMADLASLHPRPPEIPCFATLDGVWLADNRLGATYWCRNLRETVRFDQAVGKVLDAGHTLLLEIGPHPVLTVAMEQVIAERGANAIALGTLRRNAPGTARVATILAELWVRGVPVDWPAAYAGHRVRTLTLPTYPFDQTDAQHPSEAAPGGGNPGGWSALEPDVLEAELLTVVRAQAAEVSGAEPDPGLTFWEQGFDSATMVELRQRLNEATGLALPVTLLFDHPTPLTVASQLREELAGAPRTKPTAPSAASRTADDPIAVIAIGCRFPGGVSTPEQFWELITSERDAVGLYPSDRGWGDVGRLVQREAGFLDVTGFDPAFFHISPREALVLDPQQRLLLEIAWETFERAGIVPGTLRGNRVGVFVGAIAMDYGPRMHEADQDVQGYVLTGNTASVASGRLAYNFGLQGPVVTVDTACSSSLVALHLAVRALRSGDCAMALAGGATVMSTPGMIAEMGRQGALGPGGRCRAFSASTDGFGLSEGAGLVLLERLSDARRHGHEVLAVVCGSAVNHDGPSNGLTVPNGHSQREVIRQALADAGLGHADVDLIEAHGTGTTLGDPIEAEALLDTYGRERARPVRLGSVKSNIGHTQAASGIAGVIKAVLAMRHGVMPRTLHITEPTPHVDWSAGEVSLLTSAAKWPGLDRPRRTGVSSFGISGTNAHVILQAGDDPPLDEAPTCADPAFVPVVLSGATPAAVRDQATRLRDLVGGDPAAAPAALGAALARSRTAFQHRAAVLVGDREDLVAGLTALSESLPAPRLVTGAAVGARPVFVFPGQGTQWVGMGRELRDADPVFRERLAECEAALAPYIDWTMDEVLAGEERAAELLCRSDVVQPALFAIMVALAAVWQAYGVKPAAVIGHSQGEIAAACVAGSLCLEDAALAVAVRASVLMKVARSGGLVSVQANAERVERLRAEFGEGLEVAGLISPTLTVLAGDVAALDELLERCRAEGVNARRVDIDYASHSSAMAVLGDDLLPRLAGLRPHRGTVPLYSTVTGGRLDTTTMDGEYWLRNLCSPVRFADAQQATHADGHRLFIEVGAHPVLTVAIQENLAAAGVAGAAVGTLRRGEGGPERLLLSLAEAWAHGAMPDWDAVFPGIRGDASGLPTYPFQRQRYWLPPGAGHSPGGAAVGVATLDHPLLNGRMTLADGDRSVFTGSFSLATHPWLAEQVIGEQVLLPGTALLELAAQVGDHVDCDLIEELVLELPVVLDPGGAPTHVQVGVDSADESGTRTFTVHARRSGNESWTRHVVGTLARSDSAPASGLATGQPTDADRVDIEGLYPHLAAMGYACGDTFRGLRAMWRDGNRIWADVLLPDEVAPDGFHLHPALLDAALHPLLADATRVELPFTLTGVCLHATGATALRVCLERSSEGSVKLWAVDAAGTPVVSVDALTRRTVQTREAATDGLFRIAWRAAAAAGGAPAGTVVASPATSVGADPAAAAHEVVAEVLQQVRELLDEAGPVVVTTRAAVAARPDDDVDPAQAAVLGLLGAAQAEQPGRFTLVDTDSALGPAMLPAGEPQVAVRDGAALVPRLIPTDVGQLPRSGGWRLEVTTPGTVESLGVVEVSERELGEHEVLVSVRAAGLNFRDVMITLGLYPGAATVGIEGAGIVQATGLGVRDLAPGDRVTGFFPDAFGSRAIADDRHLARIPDSWTYARAAAVPVVYLTAYYGLVELAGLRPGQKVLVHAAAGGVGVAAGHIARSLGANVYGTAHPAKWATLRELGYPESHIASSRDTGFARAFPDDFDVVVNSLTGELLDASVALLRPGGHLVELGKTDLRDQASLPGIVYRPFDLLAELDPEQVHDMLVTVLARLADGSYLEPPVGTWDMRDAPEAIRYLQQARHIGKVVLTLPPPLDPDGTVLITGGTGTLGAIVARHLVTAYGMRNLVLAGRRGPNAMGAADLRTELAGLGASVTFAACDTADREALSRLLGAVPEEHPLTAVIHAAELIDDALLGEQPPGRIAAVLGPKVDAAWHLHELTIGHDLSAFVLFSSAAGVLGGAGQANYSAANAFLDGLAAYRVRMDLPAVSLAWGPWEEASGITGHLQQADRDRIARGGMHPPPTRTALTLLDAALAAGVPALVSARLDPAAITSPAAAPAVLHTLIRKSSPRSTRAVDDLRGLGPAERRRRLLGLVIVHVATMGGYEPHGIEAQSPLRDLGFDSLMSVELRNRLSAAIGLSLPTTLVFDHPTPIGLAEYLDDVLGGDDDETASPELTDDAVRAALASIPVHALREAGLLDSLMRLAGAGPGGTFSDSTSLLTAETENIDAMDSDALIRLALGGES